VRGTALRAQQHLIREGPFEGSRHAKAGSRDERLERGQHARDLSGLRCGDMGQALESRRVFRQRRPAAAHDESSHPFAELPRGNIGRRQFGNERRAAPQVRPISSSARDLLG
jgi:hypothetical protein